MFHLPFLEEEGAVEDQLHSKGEGEAVVAHPFPSKEVEGGYHPSREEGEVEEEGEVLHPLLAEPEI